ncbi:hypothetical protein GCM10012284_38360 [Mangrovihabitans endophyticus]|uniref:Uncharacterized protein n=1 Tax=Mangrovihabitans endophyticus TaxID=1751298 RepID=A0A8J3FPC7_9ACTN|nr:hypothetical protein GCM10012284_38360 [Mangrovihabitans endophyticus]
MICGFLVLPADRERFVMVAAGRALPSVRCPPGGHVLRPVRQPVVQTVPLSVKAAGNTFGPL